MSEQERQMEEIEISMQEAKKHVERRAAVDRLRNNPDWKLVVEQGYFENEAIRLVLLKADVSMQGDKEQGDIIRQIDSIGSFREYLRAIYLQANMADKALQDSEQTLEELAQEAVENG